MTQPTTIAEGKAEKFDSVERPPGDVASDVRKDLATMNARIDDIVAFQERKRPWYRDTSLLISVAAFFLALATSGISAYRTYRQDINSRKDALHSIFQQYHTTLLSGLATQFAFQKDMPATTDPKYPLFQNSITAQQQILMAANATYAKQANSLVGELGRNASANDLTETGLLSGTLNQFNLAEDLYKRAMDASVTVYEYVSAAQSLAQQEYYLGQKDESTATMKKALDVFRKFPNETYNPDYVNFSHAQSYLAWARFVGASDCQLSKENISQAMHYTNLLTPIVRQGSGMDGQIYPVAAALAGCESTTSQDSPPIPSNPPPIASNSPLIPSNSPPIAPINKFTLRNNRDIWGQDVALTSGGIGIADSDIDACAAWCDGYPTCKAFAFDRWKKTCYLKTALPENTIVDARSMIGVKKPLTLPNDSTTAQQIDTLPNRRFNDTPVARLSRSNSSACKAACFEDTRCVTYTFSKGTTGGPNCEIFRLSTNASVPDNSAESGFKYQTQ